MIDKEADIYTRDFNHTIASHETIDHPAYTPTETFINFVTEEWVWTGFLLPIILAWIINRKRPFRNVKKEKEE